MMAEKEFIGAIKELKQIKPRKDWVLLTKNQISGANTTPTTSILEVLPRLFLQPRIILTEVLAVFVILGVLGFAKNSVPGDPLFAVKKAAEKTKTALVSRENMPKAQLEAVNRRLDDLAKIAQNNQVKKLAPALQEYQASVAQAVKDLIKVAATTSDPSVIQQIARETQKLEESKEILQRTYGIAGLEVNEQSNPTKLVVDWLIRDLEKRSLTEEQAVLFEQAKENYGAGDFNSALIKIVQLSELTYPQE